MSHLGEIHRISVTHEIEWRIPNFNLLRNQGYHSYEFSFFGETWALGIFPYGITAVEGKYISLYLRRLNPNLPIRVEVALGLKTSSGKKYNEKKYTQPYMEDTDLKTYGSDRFLLKSQLLEKESVLLPSKVLTVFCALKPSIFKEDETEVKTAKCSYCKDVVDINEISTHKSKCVKQPIKCPKCSAVIRLKKWYDHECQLEKGESSTSTPASSNDLHLPEKKLQHDLKEFFLRKEDCDVVIKVQEQEFPAHKAILQARSPVFSSTFRNDMKERASGIVNIEDCDPSSFSDFLCFIYCGNTEVISKENVFSLFTVADKYDVQDLSTRCLKLIKENLSIDSFCDTMILALRHPETDLLKLAIDFFIKNAPKIIVTIQWQTFVAEYPTQSNELFIRLLVPDSSVSK